MAALRACGQTAVQLASRTHARPRSRTLLTIERTCPARASRCLPHGQPSNCCAVQRAGVFSLRSFSNFFFFVTRLVHHPGAAPPGPKGQRGHLMGIRRSRSRGFSAHATHRVRSETPESRASAQAILPSCLPYRATLQEPSSKNRWFFA